tara:strand:- start:808 stop:1572 length:765 start_codon:yes stop_codon:yes gene_type:complete
MKFFPFVQKTSRKESVYSGIINYFSSWVIFNKLFWKVLIIAYLIDIISKAIVHRFYDYVICYDGEKCDYVFISWIFDNQLYFSHVKHGYRDLLGRVGEWEAYFLNWASNHIEDLLNINISDSYIFYFAPIFVMIFVGMFISGGKIKSSTNLLCIGLGLGIAGTLGNRTELFLFGWATDFIGLPRDGIIDRIPNFIFPLGSGIANIADFFIYIGRILFFLSLFDLRNYSERAIPLPQTSNISQKKSLVKKTDIDK